MEITAIEMAREAGVSEKALRAALRKAAFPWHAHNDRWNVIKGSPQHAAMQRVLDTMRR
jgi:hypothetical protein